MNSPLTPFLDKRDMFNSVTIYAKAYLQKHLLDEKWGLFKCRESLIQSLKAVRDKPVLVNISVPAEYLGIRGVYRCISFLWPV